MAVGPSGPSPALPAPAGPETPGAAAVAARGGVGVFRPVVAALLLALPTPALAQFSARPVILEFAGRDTVETAVVQVLNEGASPLQVRVYAADFEQAESGDHDFSPLGEHPRSCAGRLAIFPEAATLGPGERHDVRVALAPGGGTCWSVVFLENTVATGGEIRIGQRIGVKVYGIPAGATREGEIGAIDAAGDAVTFRFDNTGTAPLRPRGTVEIRNLSGEVVRTLPVEPFSALPGHHRVVTVPVGDPLPAGRYLAVPVLDFGADHLVGGQAIFGTSR